MEKLDVLYLRIQLVQQLGIYPIPTVYKSLVRYFFHNII